MPKLDPEAARQRDQVLRTVLESIPHCVFWKDRDCLYLGSNSGFARLAGFDDAADLIGQDDYDLPWTRTETDFFRKCDLDVMARGEAILNVEEPQKNALGEETWLLTSKVPLRDEAGRVFGILGMFVDITDRKRAELERDEAQAKLVVASREAGKSEIATGVLHNVGNAINSIGVGVDLLRERLGAGPVALAERLAASLRPHRADFPAFAAADPRAAALPDLVIGLSEAMRREHDRLRDELAQLTEQVAHVKDVISSQQAFARPRTAREPAPAAALAEEAARMATACIGPGGAAVRVRTAADAPVVTTDRSLVLQVLVNLLHNALQAVPADQEDGSVEIRVAQDATAGTLAFVVEDNGRGIDARAIGRLFEHGYTTRADGHGFGLHTAALSAGVLGGRLEAASDGPGRGARFTLTLPMDQAAVHPAA
ncbi:putative two-component system sensor histidine kinase [Phycisphaera mikurensis NBRC 102666]|uniref:histidine kinase n=1 Tax=Phycisphaera mikurensis (strain NBRC 102666 / KCTC 22515 / FYK2301M01) TaxID=1142394 RepID=I0IFL1_PHYMF|nr:putative two-component system sensor histidine kinase [Phycisphaera mikurensis NBRC 102666]